MRLARHLGIALDERPSAILANFGRVDTALPEVASGTDGRPQVAVWKVRELLSNAQIRIPDYQRPYAWTSRNVAELVDDIQQFTPNGDYRIGTVILHRHRDEQGE